MTGNAANEHRRQAAYHIAIATAIEDGTFGALESYSESWVPVAYVAEQLNLTVQAANNRLRRRQDETRKALAAYRSAMRSGEPETDRLRAMGDAALAAVSVEQSE